MNPNGTKTIKVLTEEEVPLIKRLFKSAFDQLLTISHFSVILITPEKNAYIVSARKDFSDYYKEKGYHKFDNTMYPLMYEKMDFYTWADGFVTDYQDEIKAAKKKFRLHNGTVFVRKIGDYRLLYCVATDHPDELLERGDFIYNELRSQFEEHAEGILVPKIMTFSPFLDREIPCLATFENKNPGTSVTLSTL